MSWYKIAKREDNLLEWIESHGDDGAEAWTKGKQIFISIGDWADNDIIDDLEREIECNVDWDYEAGPEGYGWVKIK